MDKMVSLFRKDRNVKVRKASLDRFQTFPTAILQCVFVCRSLFYILSGEERKREKRKERERERGKSRWSEGGRRPLFPMFKTRTAILKATWLCSKHPKGPESQPLRLPSW